MATQPAIHAHTNTWAHAGTHSHMHTQAFMSGVHPYVLMGFEAHTAPELSAIPPWPDS